MKSNLKKIVFSNFALVMFYSASVNAEDTSQNLPVLNEPTEIRITGALTPMGLERIGKPVSIITHKEMQERSEPTIGELLSSEPGVSSSYFGPGASRPIIRGQSKQRVRVIENGLENGDLSSLSDDHAVSLDPLSTERIDILRGPSTLLYGSSAIGGVVNMIDKSINEEYIGQPLTGEIDIRKGNPADDEEAGAVSLNGAAGKFNWHFSSYYRDTEDIEIPGFAESKKLRDMEAMQESTDGQEGHNEEAEQKGKLENSDTLSKGVKIGTTYLFDKGYLGLALRVNSSNYGTPGGHGHGHNDEDDENIEGELAEQVRIDLDQTRLESRGELELDHNFFKSVRFGTSYSEYKHKELEGDEIGTRFHNQALEGRIELTHSHQDDFEGGLGSQIKYDNFKVTGDEAFVPKSETFTPAFFAVEDYKINEKLVWQLGSRYEYVSINPEDYSNQDFNLLSASTGLVKNLDSKNIYTAAFNLSYSERAPTSTELYADGVHVATQTFEIGDPNLNKEKSVGSEIVFRKNLGRLSGSSSIFMQHYFDYINLTPNGDDIDDVPVYLYEMNRARFWGFETEADYALYTDEIQSFNLYGQIDYVRGDNLSANSPLPRITPLRGKTGVKYTIDNLSTYVEGTFVAAQNRIADYELSTDRYTLLDVGLSYQLPINDKQDYEVYLRGTNLTNEEARIHNSFLKDVAPLRGRAILAGLRLVF